METGDVVMIIYFVLVALWFCWTTWNGPNDDR